MCCEATRAGEAFSRARREIRPVYSLGAAATGVTMRKRSSSKGAGSGSVARSRRNSSRRNDGGTSNFEV